MSNLIFLSHNHADKPVVEPIAIRLRNIFGEQNVFYDSWSIQPGDGIIDKMNQGLTAPKFVFFFVSAKSLNSNMVKLEWQNALFKATHGECKIIPVRVDDSQMPAVLLQSVYIDLFANGIEATIVQIVNVIQGNNTFTPQHLGFSNLTYELTNLSDGSAQVMISASHLMEPNPEFAIMLSNGPGDFDINLNGGQPHRGGFNPDVTTSDGFKSNCQVIAPLGGAITPSHPLKVIFNKIGGTKIVIHGVLHRKTADIFEPIPTKSK